MERSEHIRLGKRVSVFVIAANLLLSISKIAAGILSGLISVTADGINNLSDASASVVSLLGFRLSEKPADDEHPFGHARYEYISGLTVAFLVMFAGFELFTGGIRRIVSPQIVNVSGTALAVLAVSLTVKVALWLYCAKMNARLASVTVTAVSQDSRNDCAVTAAVLISGIISPLIGFDLDGIMTILVALFIFASGIKLVLETMRPLLGVTPPKELVSDIRERIEQAQGIRGMHDLMVHDYGPGHCFASVHVEMPASQSVYATHDIVDGIERRVMKELGVHLLIHCDPVGEAGPEIKKIHEKLRTLTGGLSSQLSMHDFHIDGDKVYFDLVEPDGFPISDEKLRLVVCACVEEAYPGKIPVIGIDHGLISLENSHNQE